MKLSIVVLTHNRLAALRECLTRIQSNTVETDAEVLIVNNGSTDGTAEWLRINMGAAPLPVTVIPRETNEGVCARNHGIIQARGDFIAQVDDDVMVMAGWDRILLEPMENDPTIGATGQESNYQEQSFSKTPWSAGLVDDRRRPQVGDGADLLMGYCWSFRNVRGPDGTPLFMYDWAYSPRWFEEADLQMQLRAAGYRLITTRSVAVHRSLPHCHSQAESMAASVRNFESLKKKWQGNPKLTFEGPRVGLR